MRKKPANQRVNLPARTRGPLMELTAPPARSAIPIRSVIKVVIVDDDADLRHELAQILTDMDGFACIGAYSNSWTSLQEIPRKQPEIVLMDVRMRAER